MNTAHVAEATDEFKDSTAAADACCDHLKSSHRKEFTLPTSHLEEQYTYIARSSVFARLDKRKPLERPLPSHLYDWLGPQAAAWRSDRPLKLLEVYCGDASNLSKLAQRKFPEQVLRIGLQTGQDLMKPGHRKKLYELMEWARPEHTHVAWPCKGLGGFNRINLAKLYSTASATAAEARSESTVHLKVFEHLAHLATDYLLGISGENPQGSDAWKMLSSALQKWPRERPVTNARLVCTTQQVHHLVTIRSQPLSSRIAPPCCTGCDDAALASPTGTVTAYCRATTRAVA